jgi:hypothetical protein
MKMLIDGAERLACYWAGDRAFRFGHALPGFHLKRLVQGRFVGLIACCKATAFSILRII